MIDKNYWVISMKAAGVNFASYAIEGGFVALGWGDVNIDLSPFIDLEKKEFTENVYSAFQKAYPEKTNKSLMSGINQLYRFLTAFEIGDVVLLRDTENGVMHFGRISGAYTYRTEGVKGTPFSHSRTVTWIPTVEKTKFSQKFLNAAGGALTLFSISDRSEEIEQVLNGGRLDSDVENGEFGMEAHLEDFIVENWERLPEFKNYRIYEEEGVVTGKQYVTNIGRMDILARSTDGKEWLVIELKRGKTCDDVVGQTLRYIGWIIKNEAEAGDTVRGLIIAGQEDEKLMYALETVQNIGFLTYSVQFSLSKVK